MKKANAIVIKVVVALCSFALAFAFAGCSAPRDDGGGKEPGGNGPREPLPYSVGAVKIVSNQTEYEPLSNWVSGLEGGIFADGAGLIFENGELIDPLGNATGELPTVRYADDFRVVIDGESAGMPRYVLFDGQGAHLSESDAFSIPEDNGEYFLCIALSWSNNDTDEYLEYSGYQYFFKIVIG